MSVRPSLVIPDVVITVRAEADSAFSRKREKRILNGREIPVICDDIKDK